MGFVVGLPQDPSLIANITCIFDRTDIIISLKKVVLQILL